MERIKVSDKYEIIINWLDNEFKCLRYGEEWRDLVGDQLILTMANRIQELEDILIRIRNDFSLWKAGRVGGQDQYAGLPPFCRLIDEKIKP